jgi:hypothetical protein
MYCRNVCLRTEFVMPRTGRLSISMQSGLCPIWTTLAGAEAITVEAQQDFEPEIRCLAAHNRVSARIYVGIALAGGTVTAGATAGVRPTTSAGAAASRTA